MNIQGFFCEDIRPEIARTESIVGILPDNMSVPTMPGLVPKLGVYYRVQIFPHDNTQSIVTSLKTPWGQIIPLGEVKQSLIDQTMEGARANNLPYAGLVMRAMLSPFAVQGYGLITAMAAIDGGEAQLCAMLNIIPATQSATVSPPPASQSPSAS